MAGCSVSHAAAPAGPAGRPHHRRRRLHGGGGPLSRRPHQRSRGRQRGGRRGQPSRHGRHQQGLQVRQYRSIATALYSRYDDGPGWSDCDPFELIRFRVLRLIHGGSQCEEMKNITKHCTPHDFPYGTHWLIQVSAATALLWMVSHYSV